MYLRTQQVFLHLRGALGPSKGPLSKGPNGATGGGCGMSLVRNDSLAPLERGNNSQKDVKVKNALASVGGKNIIQ